MERTVGPGRRARLLGADGVDNAVLGRNGGRGAAALARALASRVISVHTQRNMTRSLTIGEGGGRRKRGTVASQ